MLSKTLGHWSNPSIRSQRMLKATPLLSQWKLILRQFSILPTPFQKMLVTGWLMSHSTFNLIWGKAPVVRWRQLYRCRMQSLLSRTHTHSWWTFKIAWLSFHHYWTSIKQVHKIAQQDKVSNHSFAAHISTSVAEGTIEKSTLKCWGHEQTGEFT